jgi:hypothetical protein
MTKSVLLPLSPIFKSPLYTDCSRYIAAGVKGSLGLRELLSLYKNNA